MGREEGKERREEGMSERRKGGREGGREERMIESKEGRRDGGGRTFELLDHGEHLVGVLVVELVPDHVLILLKLVQMCLCMCGQ